MRSPRSFTTTTWLGSRDDEAEEYRGTGPPLQMSAEATGWVWKHSPYSGAQLLVHLAIADVVNDAHDNEFWMSTYKLATKAKVSRSTVTATLSDMVRDRLLWQISSGAQSREPSRYRFLMTSATTGLALGQSNPATSAIEGESLDRSPRAIPKEINQERKAAEIFAADERARQEAAPAPWIPLGLTRQQYADREKENAT